MRRAPYAAGARLRWGAFQAAGQAIMSGSCRRRGALRLHANWGARSSRGSEIVAKRWYEHGDALRLREVRHAMRGRRSVSLEFGG